MSGILLVTGKTGADKTTLISSLLADNHNFVDFALADKLKELTFKLLKLFKVDIKELDDLYDDNKYDYREYLQQIGTECCRNVFGDNFWCKLLDEDIEKALKDGKNVIISDIRYPNEINYFKNKYSNYQVFTVKVVRKDSETNDHSSEKEVDNIDANITIKNDLTDSFYDKIEVVNFLFKHYQLLDIKPKLIVFH